MKAIKRILLFLIIVAAALSFTACGDSAEIVSKTPLDVRYTPQHQEFVTDYEYKYNWWTGDFELVPNMHTETIPDKYEVLYHIEYTDGKTADKWESVNKAEYDAAAALCGGGVLNDVHPTAANRNRQRLQHRLR